MCCVCSEQKSDIKKFFLKSSGLFFCSAKLVLIHSQVYTLNFPSLIGTLFDFIGPVLEIRGGQNASKDIFSRACALCFFSFHTWNQDCCSDDVIIALLVDSSALHLSSLLLCHTDFADSLCLGFP